MGNKNSCVNNINYGNIEVFLEKNNYIEGEKVIGIIRINLTKVFPDNKIKIAFSGYKKYIYYPNLIEFLYYKNKKHEFKKYKKKFLNKEYIIFSKKNWKEIDRGHYELRFRITLPKNLYNTNLTVFTSQGKSSSVKINYELTVGLFTNNKKHNLTKNIEIQIFENLNKYNNSYPFFYSKKLYYLNYKTLFCKRKYYFLLDSKLNKNNFRYNDKIIFEFHIQSDIIDYKINYLEIFFIKLVSINKNNYETILYQNTYDNINGLIHKRLLYNLNLNPNETTINLGNIKVNYYLTLNIVGDFIKNYKPKSYCYKVPIYITKSHTEIFNRTKIELPNKKDWYPKILKGKKKTTKIIIKEILKKNINNLF